jgi:hypothetical protein
MMKRLNVLFVQHVPSKSKSKKRKIEIDSIYVQYKRRQCHQNEILIGEKITAEENMC